MGGGEKDDGLVTITSYVTGHHLNHNPAYLQGPITYIHKYTHITLHAHVYMFGSRKYMCTCGYILWAMHMCTCNILQAHVHVRIYIFNAPEADSAYMYTCKDIYYGLLFTT